MSLFTIPVFKLPGSRLEVVRQDPKRMDDVLKECRSLVPNAFLKLGDKVTLPWLMQNNSPYKNEILALADHLKKPGALALNASFEWGCSTAVAPQKMVRILDWSLELGETVMVAEYDTKYGNYFDINWPGYVGVINGVAPGRFAATINQAPMAYNLLPRGITMIGDWIVNRLRVRKNTDWLPSHLLRYVFENCVDYQTAKEFLTREKLCIPVIFSLTGAEPGQHCIIERTENDAAVHEGVNCITNHWINDRFNGRARPTKSHERRAMMQSCMTELHDDSWKWLKWPIFNRHSTLAFDVDFKAKTLKVQGLNGREKIPVTEMLTVRLGA